MFEQVVRAEITSVQDSSSPVNRLGFSYAGGILSGILALGMGVPAEAQAEDTANVSTIEAVDSGDRPGGADRIESVTVTARRREENVQSVPIPISTLSGSTLEQSGQFRTEELNQKLPSTNVQFSNPRQSSIAIRGLGNNPANDGLESSVGVYLDNVYLGRPGMVNLDLIDIDQVALLRGPQGTLFGKNTTAGVLNITTRKPTFTPEAQVESSYGERGYYQLRGAVSGPLYGDTVAGRLSVAKTSRADYIRDPINGGKYNGSERFGTRGQLLFNFSEDFDLRVAGDYNREDARCCVNVLYSPGPNNGTLFYSRIAASGGTVVYDPDYRTTTINDRQFMEVRQGGGSAEANLQLGDFKLTSITAYRTWKFDPTNDADASNFSAIIDAGQHVDDEQWTQELRIASPTGRTVEYVAGLYYFYQEQDNSLRYHYGPAAGGYLGSAALNNAQSNTRQRLQTNSISAFAQATWHVTDTWSLTAGARETSEEKTSNVNRDPATGGPLAGAAFPVYSSGQLRTKDNNYSALLSAGYQVTPDILAYASVARGAKAGGINPIVPSGGLTVDDLFIKPEKATDYELGFKSTLLDQRLQLNANLFWTVATDYQSTIIAQTAPGVFVQTLSNIGRVRTRGVETEITSIPLEGLNLSLTASYNDAIYLSYHNAPCSAEAIAAGQTVCDLSGQQIVGAPRWNINPSVSYTHALFSGFDGYARADYAWRSDFFGSPDNSQLAKIDGYGLLNLRLGVRGNWGDRGWEASLWGSNILDKRYVVGGTGAGQYRSYLLSPGAPKTVGLSVRVNF